VLYVLHQKSYPWTPYAPLVVFASASPTRHGLDDLDLFAVLFYQKADVDDAVEAGVQVIVIFSGWVRGMRGRLIHVNTSSVLAAPPGSLDPPAGASYVVNIRIISGLY
jgi:hypothetical protein